MRNLITKAFVSFEDFPENIRKIPINFFQIKNDFLFKRP